MSRSLAILILGMTCALARPVRADGPWGYFRIPDLTQDQKTRMDALWLAYLRDVMVQQALLQQASVELRFQVTAENPDAAAVKKAVERVGTIKTQILEANVRLVLEVKKLLKPEQLRWFNLDLIGRARFSDHFVEPDVPIQGGGPQPGGPQGGPQGGPGFGGPPGPAPGGPSFGPPGGDCGSPGGPGVCGPTSDDDREKPAPAKKGKGVR